MENQKMFVLEYKQMYIVPEPLTKNRTCQSYRWKQYAVCEAREPLEALMSLKKEPRDWRIASLACQKNDGNTWSPASYPAGWEVQ